MSNHTELYKIFTQKQERYTYYLIALSVTAIGYAVHQTSGEGFKITQVLLGLAVFCWGVSAYLGLHFMQLITSTVFANMGLLKIRSGKDPIAGTDPQRIQLGNKVVTEIMESNSLKGQKIYNWQNRFFYVATLLYISWHHYEMYLRTV